MACSNRAVLRSSLRLPDPFHRLFAILIKRLAGERCAELDPPEAGIPGRGFAEFEQQRADAAAVHAGCV